MSVIESRTSFEHTWRDNIAFKQPSIFLIDAHIFSSIYQPKIFTPTFSAIIFCHPFFRIRIFPNFPGTIFPLIFWIIKIFHFNFPAIIFFTGSPFSPVFWIELKIIISYYQAQLPWTDQRWDGIFLIIQLCGNRTIRTNGLIYFFNF